MAKQVYHIEIDSDEVSPQSLNALNTYLGTRGEGEELTAALRRISLVISTDHTLARAGRRQAG